VTFKNKWCFFLSEQGGVVNGAFSWFVAGRREGRVLFGGGGLLCFVVLGSYGCWWGCAVCGRAVVLCFHQSDEDETGIVGIYAGAFSEYQDVFAKIVTDAVRPESTDNKRTPTIGYIKWYSRRRVG